MSEHDVDRYLTLDVAGIGLVENAASEVVCYHADCEGRITVDPATLVLEDDGCEVVSEIVGTGEKRVEIYCSDSCRDAQYGLD